jgi:hypothetical protein
MGNRTSFWNFASGLKGIGLPEIFWSLICCVDLPCRDVVVLQLCYVAPAFRFLQPVYAKFTIGGVVWGGCLFRVLNLLLLDLH